MWFHADKFGKGLTIGDWFAVIWHGLPLDFSMSGYISILPFLLVLVSVFVYKKIIGKIINIYTYIILAVSTIIFSVDLDLYAYWNFRFDTTPLAFLATPAEASASFDPMLIFRQIAIMAVYFSVLFFTYRTVIFRRSVTEPAMTKRKKTGKAVLLLFVSALLFLPIRGGISDAVMNVGWVYFSDNMFLNHAAINPFWNFMDSLFRKKGFDKQYKFMPGEQAQVIVDDVLRSSPHLEDVTRFQNVLRLSPDKPKPNVILVVLESFSANVIGCLGGDSTVTPNLNRLSKEGVLFKNFYGASFRTDRGVSAILSGYPSQPRECIMKYPTKTGNLPNLGKTLKNEGYDLSFYYGGDENFTNMRSYLFNGGFRHIVSDKDFSRSDYASRWGAADGVVFNRMLADLSSTSLTHRGSTSLTHRTTLTHPFFNVLLTLNSHEPFTVPMKTKFEGENRDNLYRNAVYYTDSCIGDFIAKAKKQKWWDNTVIAFISDHAFNYPEGIEMHVPQRFHIIMLWLGGAIDKPMVVDKTGFQPDFINTLLSELEIGSADFQFGKNLLDPNAPEFACYTYNHGIGFVAKDGVSVIDLNTNKTILQHGKDYSEQAKAFLQVSFDDFAKR
ncbi:MAG: sulfatase-like hydrolase/transferase [Prevotellaceae bacterium]|jgi:phosphoglycerol transferase MdoB-like AlkP superfamily enzyme|nr:sulfatase-like hydrolase/transferase [Prevotellaceae bacterium]